MKYPTEKMRACLALLPPPGGEVVAECLDEIESLRKHVTLLREVMNRIAVSRTGECIDLAQKLFDREDWGVEDMNEYFDVTDITTAEKEQEMDLYHIMRKAAQADKQQLATAQSEIEQAFREGFRSSATYNDILVNDEDTEWENYKRRK